MNKVIDFIKDNRGIFITLIIVLIVSCTLYFINHKKYTKEYEKDSSNPEFSDVDYISKNYKANEYNNVTVELQDLLNEYYKDYIVKSIDEPEEAFKMLSEESKKLFKNDIEEYKKYVKQQSSINTKNNKVVKYRENASRSKAYDIVDSEQNKFTIVEKAIWDLEIEIKGKE